MAVIKRAIPFNNQLKVATVPTLPRVKLSLFGTDKCEFTVINFRDESVHVVEVQVTGASQAKSMWDGSWDGRTFVLAGKILKVDGKEWGEPYNKFSARFVDGKPELCAFMVVDSNVI